MKSFGLRFESGISYGDHRYYCSLYISILEVGALTFARLDHYSALFPEMTFNKDIEVW